MDEVVDGEMQNFKAKGGAYTRENFFGKHPEALKLVKGLSDEEIYKLNRGSSENTIDDNNKEAKAYILKKLKFCKCIMNYS